jgi:hypothetical protein
MNRAVLCALALWGARAFAADPGTDLVEYSIDPKDADPAVTDWPEPHLALRDTAVPSNGLLFLFLPGHKQLPSDYRLLLQTAARKGYWVLGLRYPNSWAVRDIIDASEGCTENGRREILDGAGESKLGISPADSLQGRLVSALKFLASKHPADAWGRFLDDGKPVWKAMTVAGHSFGGGEAALIASLTTVRRVVLFSSPDDHCRKSSAPPAWVTPGATPSIAFFGLGHLDDPSFDTQRRAWSQLGMLLHPAADRDALSPPYRGANALTTRAKPQTGRREDAHQSTADDAQTPLHGASPLFQGTWEYAIGP